MNRSTVLALTVVGIVAALTIIWLSGGDRGSVRPALAGPCGADPELVFQDQPNDPLDGLNLLGRQGKTYSSDLRVKTVPNVLPPGKPPVTIDAIDVNGDDEIEIAFLPDSSNGSFDTLIGVKIGANVPPGVYEYDIKMVCHTEQITIVSFFIYVDTCPLPFVGFSPAGNGTPTAEPFPSGCAAPSPSPGSPTPTSSATPTETPIETPVETPTPAPFPWGDVDCSGGVNSVDSLKELRWIAQLPLNQPQGCPDIGEPPGQQFRAGGAVATPFGDVDCSGSVTSVDALKILRFVAQLPVSQTEPCTDIGEPLG